MKSKQQKIPRILVTMGEPAGIGPELIVRLAQLEFNAQIIVLADPHLLLDIAKKLNLELTLSKIDWHSSEQIHQVGHLFIEAHFLEEAVEPGILNKPNALTTLSILARASELGLNHKVDAVVTGPVHKANLNQVEPTFLGHTEFFAEKAGKNKVVMMLASGDLRVTLATTHIALSKVSAAITEDNLIQTINVIIDSFDKFNIKNIKIAVCGLNPHAGEDGLLGDEEIKVIAPVIEKLQSQGHSVFGPFPADTLFTPQKRKDYDVFLAMYHDQGLPVIKAFGFGRCANITLGLPYIRTSVDHGTALDIAASYRASPESIEYAINYAIELATGNLPNESI